jgi:hypothetical protein
MILVSASALLRKVLRVTRTALRTELERCIRVDCGLGRVELTGRRRGLIPTLAGAEF